jgi:ribosomal protein S18 acetylase RimI-like enzyme
MVDHAANTPNAMTRKTPPAEATAEAVVAVRRMHRRDINRTWEFLKLVFREVNRETVEFQRPHSKKRFEEVYEEEGIEQLLFVTEGAAGEDIVGYAECAFEVLGSDNWINQRYFDARDMRPMYVEELAVHPDYQGRGLGSFMLAQLEHLAKLRGCTHLVLEVAENNERALAFYKARTFYKLDAAIFLAKRLDVAEDLLPPAPLKPPRPAPAGAAKPVKTRRPAGRARPLKTQVDGPPEDGG